MLKRWSRASVVGAIVCAALVAVVPDAQPHAYALRALPALSGEPLDALFGVACPQVTVCFAVGYQASQPLAERWDGRSWSVTPIPPVAGGAELLSVSCSSPTNCTAVGSGGLEYDAVEVGDHWNGTEWTAEPMPPTPAALPSYTATPVLTAVSCPAARYCVAAGSVGETSDGNIRRAVAPLGGLPPDPSLAIVWDGSAWHSVTMPGSFSPMSVACPTPRFCVAVGGAVESWNGARWSTVTLHNAGAKPVTGFQLNSVSCSSPHACTAVGTTGDDRRGVAMRWYHGRWSIRRVNAAIYLKSVACSTATTCTALTDDPNAGPGAAIATRYIGMEGGRWFPQWVSGTKTISIACPSQRVCVAVGIGAALWNGREWSNVSIATPPPDLADKRAAAERQHRRKPTGDRRGELTRTVVAKALSWGKHSPR